MASSKAATMNNHMCLRSSVCMCTHVHAWFQIKYVTRNKSHAKGKAWSWPRHVSFILNPKLGWSLADGHKHSHQSTEVSTNVVMEDLPIVSTRASHILCSQGVPIAAVIYVTDWCVTKLRFAQVNLHANHYWEINIWSVNAGYYVVSGWRTRLLPSVTCS